jgi:metallo-beta-lactamase class B
MYKPAKVDRVLRDGDEVKLGDSVLIAHLTAGHTKGCTTWTMKVKEGTKTYNAVIVGSPNINPGYKLVDNKLYPQIAEDYEKGFRVLKSLPCDFFLGAHGSYFDMETKYVRFKAGLATAFVDPNGYTSFVYPKGTGISKCGVGEEATDAAADVFIVFAQGMCEATSCEPPHCEIVS